MSFEGKSGDGGGSENKQLGVLLAGYLEKQNPYGKVFRKRFVVLTQDAFHWFKVPLSPTRLVSSQSPILSREKKKIIYSVKKEDRCP